MKYRLLTLLLLFFIGSSCEDEDSLPSTGKKFPKEVSFLSLSDLPELSRVLDFVGFQHSSGARTNAAGLEIDVDSILQILQTDNIHNIYTFKIRNDNDSSFSNLVIEELETGHLAYILQYAYESKYPVLPNFTGQISKFDLAQNLLSVITLDNGVFVSVSEPNANGKALRMATCLIGTSVSTECEPTEGNSTATGLPLDFLGETCTTTITLIYGLCDNGGGGGGASDPGEGTYVPPSPGGGSGGGGSGGGGGGSNPPAPPKPKVGVLPPVDDIGYSIEEQMDEMLKENPFALLEIDCDQLPKWQSLAQHTPPQSVVDKIADLRENNDGPFGDWDIQYLEEAEGAVINMDFWPVSVTTMPNKPDGTPYTPGEFLQFFRKNINDFLDEERFVPYERLGLQQQETILWNSANPVGAIININIDPNDGVVVCSEISDQYWRFMTLEAPFEWSHPVSGTREFGYEQNPDGSYTFYTRGVDRFNSSLQELVAALQQYYTNNYATDPFVKADEFWQSLQDGMLTQIQQKGGVATAQQIVKERVNYETIRDVLNGTKPISDLGCK